MTRFAFRILAAVAAAPLIASAPAQAQQMIEAGKTVTGAASASDQPAMYMFVGEVGSTVTLDLKGPGPLALDLFDGEGQAILSAEGDGKARLEAVLPFTEIYFVAVRRGRKGAPFTLALASDVPDPHRKLFSYAVGYSRMTSRGSDEPYEVKSCWLIPGAMVRYIWPKGEEDIALGRDGMEYGLSTVRGQQPKKGERQVEIEGDVAKYRNLDPNAKVRGFSMKIVTHRTDSLDSFFSYRCP